jgi:teichuronic acid biosynthesis glycosyltransferase TuaG
MPTISIITPAYNASATISETIRSVQHQTFTDWEWLIVDDGSIDETAAVVRSFESTDSRIRLIETLNSTKPSAVSKRVLGFIAPPRTHSRQAKARNIALRVAKGRFIAFIDADDLWLPEKLERQLAFTIQQGAMMTYCQYRRFSTDPTCPGPVVSLPNAFTHESLCGNTAIAGALTVMIDTAQSGPLRFPDFPHEDLCLWLKLLRNGQVAKGLPEDLCRYRVSSNSSSGNKLRSALETWLVFRKFESFPIAKSCWFFLQYAARSALRRILSRRC